MRIVSRKAQACEQVRLRASQLRDRTAVHVRPPREWPRAGHEPSAKTARWDRRAARCPQEKRGVSAVLAGMVEGTDQIGQTMKSLSSWPNGKSPRAGGTNFSGLLADRADQIDLDAAAVDQQSRSSNRGARGRRPEELLPDLVEGEEVVEVGEEHLRLHHLIERTAGGLKGALQVIQNVAGLLLDRRAVVGKRGIDPRFMRNAGAEVRGELAGREHQIAGAERLGVIGERLRVARGDRLARRAAAGNVPDEID